MVGRACSQNEKNRSAFNILTDKAIRKRPLRRSRHRWEDNISVSTR